MIDENKLLKEIKNRRDFWFSKASKYAETEDEMIDLKHYDRVMNVMSLENCFCEFSKYYKACTNTGRPRAIYKPKRSNV